MNSTRNAHGFPVGRAGRVLLVAWSLFLLAGFSLAFQLEPDPRGFGTHQALGLPPCSFQAVFDMPCPSCGMTTRFANFTRGRLAAAAQANVAGLVLAIACAVQIPWCWISTYTGRFWKVSRPVETLLAFVVVIGVLALGQWVVRVTV